MSQLLPALAPAYANFASVPGLLRFAGSSSLLNPVLPPIGDDKIDITGKRFAPDDRNPFSMVSCPQRPLLLMSDYDGTLHPLMPNYKQSFLTPEKLETIRRVATQPGVFFSIVSGRPMDQLLNIFGSLAGTPMLLAGSHGGEIYDLQSGTYLKRPSPENKALANGVIEKLTANGVFALPGMELEAKDGSFTIHYDNASPESVAYVKRQIAGTLAGNPLLSQTFTTRDGKKVIEVVPKEFNKGSAVLNILPYARRRFGPNVPIHTAYAGDDISDYAAMKVVHTLGGCTFLVSQTPKHETDAFVTKRLPDNGNVFQYFQATIGQDVQNVKNYYAERNLKIRYA